MYKNREGYSDPTAGVAMSRVMKEYKQKQRREWARKEAIKNRPVAYVASRYAGDIAANVDAAAEACRYVAKNGYIPVCPHIMYPNMGFDDNNPEEREMCCLFGLALLKRCDELWCFTVDGYLSPGMRAEETEAKRLGIPVRYIEMEVI